MNPERLEALRIAQRLILGGTHATYTADELGLLRRASGLPAAYGRECAAAVLSDAAAKRGFFGEHCDESRGQMEWIGRTFRLRETLRGIGHMGRAEYLHAGAVVLVTSEKTMHVVTVRVKGMSLTVFTDALEAASEEVDGTEYQG